jgi:DNA-binding NtrC family response regulator
MSRILVISDSKAIEELLKPYCEECTIFGYNQRDNHPVGNQLEEFDIAFIDLSHEAWRESLRQVRQRLPVIGFSARDVADVVEAMQLGASDVIDKTLTKKNLEQAINKHRRKYLSHRQGFDEIVGNSSLMQEVFSLVKKAALTESNVLITGESGTGKEPVARAIHRWSPRKLKSFMTINCSAIPDTLLESELFGFEKGSFTGANYTKKGILELADGGTVFFDEVGDVSPLFQTKVLRVIQEGEFMKVGGSRHHHVDVRFIAATNRDLKALCKKGTFREDLYYRLNVINIHLPPLRQRMEDVPLLVRHFIKKHGPKRKDILIRDISDDALNMLMNYQYPGNVRELENIIEQAISFSSGPEILPSSLPAFLQQVAPRKRAATPRMREAVASYERELIWSALQEARGNISRAAQILGIYRQQLQRKIKQLKIAT